MHFPNGESMNGIPPIVQTAMGFVMFCETTRRPCGPIPFEGAAPQMREVSLDPQMEKTRSAALRVLMQYFTMEVSFGDFPPQPVPRKDDEDDKKEPARQPVTQ